MPTLSDSGASLLDRAGMWVLGVGQVAPVGLCASWKERPGRLEELSQPSARYREAKANSNPALLEAVESALGPETYGLSS